jgi:glucose-6-phosphate isomerase
MNAQKLGDAVERRIERFEQDQVARRIWAKDHTVWRPEPTEITDRLGWLTVHEAMRGQTGDLKSFAEGCASDGFRTAILAGMGGSSLAPEVFRETFGVARGFLDLIVLDTTHPDQIRSVEEGLDLDRTLFVIASKSGGTTETLSHFAYFWEKVPDGSHFVCITDPGTSLQKLAQEHGFRRVFQNEPAIGGRYSALSHFGLVNAALVGVDLDGLLAGAHEMSEACGPDVPAAKNPGMALGAAMGESALGGRNKLTTVLPREIQALGYWVEQLIAESTGKEGKGIVPVEGEDLGNPDVYGDDRLFVATGGPDGGALDALVEAGNPEVRIPFEDTIELGGEMFRWEFATAVAGAVIGIHPFDQPDVQSAKDATKRILAEEKIPDVDPGDLNQLLSSARSGDYLAIQAYIPRNQENIRRLHGIRMRMRDRMRIATMVGFGPRFLHSTGQLHKGGPNTGVFIQVVDRPHSDLSIPGQSYTFGHLIAAQAAGDLMELRDRDRRVARVSLAELESA